ncbi:MAG: DUF302 domain-containing protein [Arenicellales bacterium]|jgi:uncharacterized protein (DUF302 family)|nr:DUF302 domain-containing protein [Arenicellales bacterium]
MRNTRFAIVAASAVMLLLGARFAAAQELSPEAAEELKPQVEAGARLLSDMSEEAQAYRRKELAKTVNPVMDPVPRKLKKQLYDQLSTISGMSMRQLFNFMTAKKKVAEGVEFDDVVEAMEIKANEVNFKKVGHNQFWKDVGAITGEPALRVEILQFCDATVGRRMLDFSPEFAIFIPCRISVVEQPDGSIWLMTLDWDVSWLAMAWRQGSSLPEDLKQDAIRVRDAMTEIMEAGANAEW